MRKIIETSGPNLVCDNPDCSFEIDLKNLEPDELYDFINTPCPNCDANLLTKKDYDTYMKVHGVVRTINKWFGWISIFYSKKERFKGDPYSVKCHDGIHIREER